MGVRCGGTDCDGKLVWSPSNETFTWQPWSRLLNMCRKDGNSKMTNDYRMDSLYGPKITGTTANTALECLWYINHGPLRWFAQDLCSAARAAYCVFRCINLIAMPFFI